MEDDKSFLHIKIRGGLSFFLGYISPNISIRDFERKISEIMEEAELANQPYVIAGDLNAKAVEWGSPITDARGEILLEWIAARNLTIHNDGRLPTCVTANGESFIDITVSSPGMVGRVKEWKVSLETNLSDHRFIYYDIALPGRYRMQRRTMEGKRNLDRERYKRELRGELSRSNIEDSPVELTDSIKRVMERCTLRRSSGNAKVPYWWNPQIERLREKCNAARRRRLRGRARRTYDQEQMIEDDRRYKELKKELQKEIRRAKRQMWRDMCKRLDEDIWGKDTV